MIVLDTPVIAEIMRPKPHKYLLEWLNAQDAQQLFLTAISVAELFASAECLADNRQKAQVSTLLLEMLNQDFAGRLLAFDAPSALIYAQLYAENQAYPTPLNYNELQTTAICRHHQARLATSEVARFSQTGIALLNPWENQGSPRWREEAAEYFIMSRKS
ncbi:MAG: PIN domain-containing protein [Rouxiella badensis]|jgi:predicted nucleic acid-binding protein|uniref:PIN domain-containing protein n=1 Tax=Rouxiella badensis TaxID=1646377 RepID=UPI0017877D76|nr:PIN domain-containing protein [Rouxiella badensis]QOI56837.1 PIN domain-containing protein [Rouxiella badensis subsp. acadiensis]